MGDSAALDGMARALLRRGVTSFLPTAVTAPLDALDRVRRARARLAAGRSGRRRRAARLQPRGSVPRRRRGAAPTIRTLLRIPRRCAARRARAAGSTGCRLMTVAPELPGCARAHRLASGARASRCRSATRRPNVDEARAGYAAGGTLDDPPVQRDDRGRAPRAGARRRGARPTTRSSWSSSPTASTSIRALWPLIIRLEAGRPAAAGQRRDRPGRDGRRSRPARWPRGRGRRRPGTLAGTTTLAGSVIALDSAVRNLVASGVPLPAAVAAASANPLALLGVTGPRPDRRRPAGGPRRARRRPAASAG